MKSQIFIIFFLVLFSCKNVTEKDSRKHENLIAFRSKFIMDMDEIFDKSEADYQRLTDEMNFHIETDTILYLTDTIYISYLTYVNACAEYDGNIEFKNDSLFLKAHNIRNEECASGRIDRFIYKIYNPENKEFKIVKY